MRIVPIITALLVMVFLFLIVIQRDALFEYVGATQANEVSDSTAASADEDASPYGGETDTAQNGEKVMRVIAVHSKARPVDNAVILRGETRAARQVEVRAETSAIVTSEPLRKGATVERGTVLCELDIGTRQASLAEARARLAEARARVPETEARKIEAEARLAEALINDNAAAKLKEGGYASDTRVAAARAAVQSARAGVESAKSGLESTKAGIESAEAAVLAAEREITRLTIRAPFAGMLETDAAELGSLLQPGAICGTIIQLDPIKIVGFIPELDVAKIEVGALAGARLATGDELVGNVSFISRSADPLTRTFLVEIDVPNADLKIRDGQTAEIMIAAAGVDAHTIPQSALTLDDEGTLGVRIVSAEKTAEFVPVTLLRDTAEGVWVKGLPEQADVIIIGQEYVANGVRVEPSFEELTQ